MGRNPATGETIKIGVKKGCEVPGAEIISRWRGRREPQSRASPGSAPASACLCHDGNDGTDSDCDCLKHHRRSVSPFSEISAPAELPLRLAVMVAMPLIVIVPAIAV